VLQKCRPQPALGQKLITHKAKQTPVATVQTDPELLVSVPELSLRLLSAAAAAQLTWFQWLLTQSLWLSEQACL